MIDIEDVRRITLKPGEKLLVTLPESTTPPQFDEICGVLRDGFGDSVLVVTSQVKFTVIDPTAAEA